jgi:hypothetical protein
MFASLRRSLRENHSIVWTLWFYATTPALTALEFIGLWLTVRARDVIARNAFRAIGLKTLAVKVRPIKDYQVRSLNA